MLDTSNVNHDNPDMYQNAPTNNPDYYLGNHNLPISAHRAEIENSILQNVVTIIEVPTGGGKSTQVTQYIHELQTNGLIEVSQNILTQPRIVAARSIAERISNEMQSAGMVEPKVGHYTQPESSPIPQRNQDIAVLTAGKAAAQLVHAKKTNNGLTILQIDEVHEMGKDIELLLAITKEKTNPNSAEYDKNLRVVIMSATLDANVIKKYYSHTKTGHVQVDVKTYPIEESESPDSAAKVALSLVQKGKTVLAFFAGKGEIETTLEKITGIQSFQQSTERAAVVTLHAQQNAEQQSEAFKNYENGVIVLATNVAETSLTLPNVVAVVDTGEVREASVSYEYIPTGHSMLNAQYAAKSNVQQRKGRAGRTEPGDFVRVNQSGGMPKKLSELPKYATPAILLDSLDDLLLTIKATGKDISDYSFLHQPESVAIEAANKKLFMLGALDKNGSITTRGMRMEKLPLDPEFACMIVYAEEQGYSDQIKQNVLDIIAIMQRGGIIERSPKKLKWQQLLATDKHGEILEQESDYIAQLEVFAALHTSIPEKYWQDFDVNTYALELIMLRREKLAQDIGLNASLPISTVRQADRELVLRCIYAGQLTQLWRRNGSVWQFAFNPKIEFEIHPTSLVSELGKIATGSLFSLGTHGEFKHSIQDVNLVNDVHILGTIADHLVTETLVKGSRQFNADKNVYTDNYVRTLGVITLQTITREVDPLADLTVLASLAKDYSERIWLQQASKQSVPEPYSPDDIPALIITPEKSVIGTNVYTNEPIYEWYGADRRPMRTEADAKKSLEALYDRIQNAPKEKLRREIKDQLDTLRAELIKLSKGRDKQVASEAKKLRKNRDNSSEYLSEVLEFISKNK